jgi:hypothetical protein
MLNWLPIRDSVTLVDILNRCAHKIFSLVRPRLFRPRGAPKQPFESLIGLATAKATNVNTFVACRLLALWDDVRTFLLYVHL